MENQKTCDLCGKEEKLYYCECGKFFCRYHHHIILHKCPFQHPIIYRLERIKIIIDAMFVPKKYYQYLDVIVMEFFVKSIDILKNIVVLLTIDL